ncbi:MAG: DUF751 family protein [Oscillatoriales cyanobacterium]|jgi:Protein of unknown function (DUF751)|nr:MAG: DUF751 family protein [Oscillatoriales cyanobacterium]
MNEFFLNVSRYPRYLITFTLGVFYSIYEWLKPLGKRPVTLAALVGIAISGFFFVTFTLRAMLGLA